MFRADIPNAICIVQCNKLEIIEQNNAEQVCTTHNEYYCMYVVYLTVV